jgi:hypothetical protein
MALSIAAGRGTATSAASGTTLVVTANANLAAGSTGVLVVSCDNAGAAGSAQIGNATLTDQDGNTWTKRADFIYDPGAASAGAELIFYTAYLKNGLLSGHTVTVGFTTAVVEKVAMLWEVVPAAGSMARYVTSAQGTGASSAAPTVTTSSITSGDAVFGGVAAESITAITGDSDTTNGSWTTQQTVNSGVAMKGSSQGKVVTATATQTYNVSWTTAADMMIGWLQLNEVVNATDGSSVGTSTTQANSVIVTAGAGSSVGAASNNVATAIVLSGVGSATGSSTAQADIEDIGSGTTIVEADGNSAGTATVTGSASATAGTVGGVTGTSTVSANSVTILARGVSSIGVSTISAVSGSINGVIAAATGVATVVGDIENIGSSTTIIEVDAIAVGVSTVTGAIENIAVPPPAAQPLYRIFFMEAEDGRMIRYRAWANGYGKIEKF